MLVLNEHPIVRRLPTYLENSRPAIRKQQENQPVFAVNELLMHSGNQSGADDFRREQRTSLLRSAGCPCPADTAVNRSFGKIIMVYRAKHASFKSLRKYSLPRSRRVLTKSFSDMPSIPAILYGLLKPQAVQLHRQAQLSSSAVDGGIQVTVITSRRRWYRLCSSRVIRRRR